MKLILVSTFFLNSFASFGQDCTLYRVKLRYTGTIAAGLLTPYKITVPTIAYLKGYDRKKLMISQDIKSGSEDTKFDITVEGHDYDFYTFKYKKENLPLLITLTDLKGKAKKEKIVIQSEDLNYEFSRDGINVKIVFNFGLIKL